MPNVEELEAVAPIDTLRRAGVDVTVASLSGDLTVTGRSRIQLGADVPFAQVASRLFDALVLPGGPGVAALRADARVVAAVREHFKNGKLVAAICAAPTVLADAGVLEGKRYTAHPSVAHELRAILSAERVVEDGSVITSRGAGTAVDFGLALVRHLVSPAKAHEVSAAICA
jgi:4-methyl-5(b-hydroxyethyl)-thiazole monophosphate biosynthesis